MPKYLREAAEEKTSVQKHSTDSNLLNSGN